MRPLLQHQNQVSVHHALNAMGDDEGGAAFHQRAQRLANLCFRLEVDRRCGVVQDQDARILEQRAGNGDALLLPARKRDAALADQRVVAVGSLFRITSWMAAARAALRPPHRHLTRHAVGDVVAHGAAEEKRLLLDDADLRRK
jgi:hypothetical protein